MRRFPSEILPWLLTALLVGYITADAASLLGRHTMAVDGKSDAQRGAERRRER